MAATAVVRCSTSEFALSSPRIAVDLLGGPDGPAGGSSLAGPAALVVDGALQAADQWSLQLLLVGPPEQTRAALATHGVSDPESAGLRIVPAAYGIAADEDPVRAVRSRRDASVRVASRLLRDGEADASVSFGPTAAAVAAALFTLGRVPGLTRPPLAVTVPTPRGPVVLLDAGASSTASADALVQYALAGAAYAAVRLGVPDPVVGLLSDKIEPGLSDPLRREAGERLAEFLPALGVGFEGNVRSDAVVRGGVVDVVVTDGFTGSVLRKALEGAFETESQGGALLLGVDGVVAVGDGSSSPSDVAACIAAAADAVRAGLVPRLTEAMAGLMGCRRAAVQVPA